MSTPQATLAAREWRLALKVEALTLINGGRKPKCACPGCDVDAPEFLACDHIHGDGKIHRELFRLGTGGAKLWSWVRDNWGVLAPAGPMGMFQALCHNCNVSKFNHPECALAGRPHSASLAHTKEKAMEVEQGAEIQFASIHAAGPAQN